MLALITGATSGLGKALCHLLAEQKIPLIISGRNSLELESLKKNLPVDVTCQTADLTNKSERQTLINLIHTMQPDLIINNAGFGLYGDALTHTTEKQLEILEVNGSAVLEISLEAARTLQEAQKPGIILNVSSAAAFFASPSFAVYSAAKAFVNQFSQALDKELKPHGIRILTACPGQIDTNFRNRAASGHPQQQDSYTMTVEKAAHEILWQIQHKKPVHIFDARYRIMTFIARYFLPSSFATQLIQKSILKRIT
ncbi:MAG: SDR family NAD(P)-dependent oxidoreductase [Chlamydiota bacterium]